MTIILLRHASAGNRKNWAGDDVLRPLDPKGLRQARELVERFREYPIERILSSSAERCLATVRPIAMRRGIEIEERAELAEGGGSPLHVLAEVTALAALVCTHGDVIEALLGHTRAAAKGAAWILEPEGTDLVVGEYLRPPA